MSVSTDGILFFGIAYDEDFDVSRIAEDNGMSSRDFDFENLLESKLGIEPPKEEFSKDQLESVWRPYWARARELKDKYPCQVGIYRSGDYPLYFVYVKSGYYCVNRGYAKEIPSDITPSPEWADQIRSFCNLMGLPFKQPQWLLVSFWG